MLISHAVFEKNAPKIRKTETQQIYIFAEAMVEDPYPKRVI